MNEKSRVSLVSISLVATLVLSGCDSIGFGPKIAKCDDPNALELTANLIRSRSERSEIEIESFTAEMILNQGIDKEIGKSSCAASFVFTNPSKEPTTESCKWVSQTEYELQYDTKGQLTSTIQKVGPLSCVRFTWEEVLSITENPIDPARQYYLGLKYFDGDGVLQDHAEAVKWFRKAADQGYADAQTILGGMYYGGRGVAQDYAKAMKWFRKAADQGNAYGQAALGAMYSKGRGVTQDDAEAAKWYRKAADQGNAYGQAALGAMYENGRGVARDYAEAVKWYQRAVKWFRKAADQGGAYGQTSLGGMYYGGRGVAQDYAKAMKWFRKAADQGNAEGQVNLATMLYAGNEIGVPYNVEQAKSYWKKVINSTPSTDQIHKLASAGLQCIREGKSSKQCEPLRCSIEGRSDCPDL